MPHTPHELAEEFPDHVALISSLKASDPHFARICDDYHKVNREVHRAETDIQPTDDFTIQDLRKKRLALKDEVWHMLKAEQAKT